MVVFLKKSDVVRMKNNILDYETRMTEFDLFEWQHSWDDIHII